MAFSSEEKKILAAANQYTEDTVIGMGAIQGASAQVANKVETDEKTTWDWKWVDENGVSHTTPMEVKNGAKGDKGDDGQGIPEGGTTGQALVKKSNADGDIEWKDVEGGGTEQIQSDWTQTDDTKKDYIKHKPENLVQDASYVHTDNNYDATAKGIVDGVTAALAGKVDKETGKSLIDLTTVVDGASYDSTNHLILFKHGSTTLFSLDAAAFVKDGMVDTVTITGGNLVITFNTDAGKQDISIPLTDIFDPDNYYNKTATDTLLGAKADQTEVNSIENYYGSKNLCVYPFFHTTRTSNGITFTDNGDGTITATGTATDNAIFNVSNRLELGKLILPNGEYKVNGCPSGGSTNSYWMVMSRTSGGEAANYGNDTGKGMTATLNGDDFSQDNVHFQIAIVIKSGYEITTPLVFKPMVRLATIKDDTFVPYAKTNRELTAYAAGQDEVSDIGNVYGAKNLIPFPYTFKSGTSNGVDITVNNDGTLTCNGTSTAVSWIGLQGVLNQSYPYLLKAGHYILTCPDAPSNASYVQIIAQDSSLSGIQAYTGHDMEFTVATDTYVYIGFRIANGQVCDNLTIHPMLRMASVKDDTYVPYAPTNAKLNEEKMSYADNGALGAKNLNSYPYVDTTKTSNGVTFTDNGDGTITANGTATADAVLNCHTRAIGTTIPLFIPNGKYVISGCPSGGSSSTYMVGTAITKNGSASLVALDYGNGRKFTLNGDDTYTDKVQLQIQIVIKSGQTVNNLVFKPMLRLASDPDNTYQPYAMTNRELTDRVIQSVVSVDRDTTTTNSGTIKLYRYGNLRILTGNFNPSVAGTSATNTHIADLPLATDYPTYSVISVCGRGETDSSATAKIGNLNIGTDGVIKYQGQATGENMFFNISWVVG